MNIELTGNRIELPIERRFYDAIVEGLKMFEVRSLRHGIEVGDLLTFTSVGDGVVPAGRRYPGEWEVVYELTGYGIDDEHAAYGIVPYLPHYIGLFAGQDTGYADMPVSTDGGDLAQAPIIIRSAV